MSKLLQDFLAARQLIDRAPPEPAAGAGKKAERNTVERPPPAGDDNVRGIIDAKPSKKVVMDFLKRKVAQYTDISSSDEE